MTIDEVVAEVSRLRAENADLLDRPYFCFMQNFEDEVEAARSSDGAERSELAPTELIKTMYSFEDTIKICRDGDRRKAKEARLNRSFEELGKTSDPSEFELARARERIRDVPEERLRYWLENNSPMAPPAQLALARMEIARRDREASARLTMRATVLGACAGIVGALGGGACGAILTYVLTN